MLPCSAYAQDLQSDLIKDKRPTLRGEVFSNENGEKVPFVHVINENTKEGTHSDENGYFEIPVSLTDSITISAVGYKKLEFTLSGKYPFLHGYNITVYLDVSYFELSTVDIYAFKDEADFKQDILNLRLPEEKNAIPLLKSRRALSDNMAPSLAINGPVSAIQNIFSKEGKELRKYGQALKDEPNQAIIRKKFNREIVSTITGLKNEELNEFILFCSISDDFILKYGEYEISQKISACLKEFKNK